MRKLVNKKNIIAIVFAILFLIAEKPANAQWNTVQVTQKKDYTLTYVCLGVAGVALIVTVVALVVRHNKNKQYSDNLIYKSNYLALDNEFTFIGKYNIGMVSNTNKFGYTEPVKLEFKPKLNSTNPILKKIKLMDFSSSFNGNLLSVNKKSYAQLQIN